MALLCQHSERFGMMKEATFLGLVKVIKDFDEMPHVVDVVAYIQSGVDALRCDIC